MTMAMISASVAMPRVEPDFGDRPTRDGDGVIDELNDALAMVQPEAGEDAGFAIALGVLVARLGRKSPEPEWRKALNRFRHEGKPN